MAAAATSNATLVKSRVRLSEHIKLHLRKSKVFSLSEVVVIIVMLSAGRTHGAEILYFLAFRKGESELHALHAKYCTKPFQSEMHIKYRRIELCKGFIFWVAVSLKLLGELQCVKQEISPLKKSSSENFCQALDNCGRLKIRLLLSK